MSETETEQETASKRVVGVAAKAATHALGIVPHLVPLAAAVGPFGLDPRVRELTALAVARAHGCAPRAAVHRMVGRFAGLTEEERRGETRGLTAAERAAIGLGLGTISRLDPELEPAPSADEHFTAEEIEQIRAVALGEDLACQLMSSAAEATSVVLGQR